MRADVAVLAVLTVLAAAQGRAWAQRKTAGLSSLVPACLWINGTGGGGQIRNQGAVEPARWRAPSWVGQGRASGRGRGRGGRITQRTDVSEDGVRVMSLKSGDPNDEI